MDIAKTAKESLLGIFKIKDINSDNVTFKLFYKVSFGLCIFSCLLVAATQYWGNPINCSMTSSSVDQKTFESHCWIHGTKRIEDNQKLFNCQSKVNVLIFIFLLSLHCVIHQNQKILEATPQPRPYTSLALLVK